MIRRFLVLLVAVLLATSGCANGTLSEEAAEDLQQRTDAARAAAEVRDVDAAQEALAGLRAALDAHAEAEAVSPERAREIATAADAVEARLPLLIEEVPNDEQPPPAEEAPPTTEPPPPPPSTTTIPEPEPGDDKDDEGDGEDQDGGEDGRGPDGEGPPGQSRAASGA